MITKNEIQHEFRFHKIKLQIELETALFSWCILSLLL